MKLECKPCERYGRLTVIREVKKRNKRGYWECLCDCGKKKIIQIRHLRSGHTKSCGCLSRSNLVGNKYGNLTVIKSARVGLTGLTAVKDILTVTVFLAVLSVIK